MEIRDLARAPRLLHFDRWLLEEIGQARARIKELGHRYPSASRRELGHSPGTRLGEADGLYFDRGALLAIQNGHAPIRVARFSLSSGLDRITGEMTLAEDDPRLPEPTTGAVAGDVMYLVGDSQLRAIGKDGTLWPREKLAPVRIYEMPLRSAPPQRDRRIR